MIHGRFKSTCTSWIKILQHPTFEVNNRKWGSELPTSEIWGSFFDYRVPHTQKFRTYLNHLPGIFRERTMFYLTTHSTHFIYGYMASDIWLRTILIVRKETRCHHIGYSYRLTARVLLYAPSHRQDNTYHGLCYASRGALAGTRNSSMGPPHEGSIRRPIAP